ncbi:MAG TPA: GNAT family N-acetyltransferase [Jatrophihabitans sp.]|jgi:putative acetyltransferase|uniref:GNAT family N-acetyltransferase n=1 Tax=Jatrophihabitans sp. TaxID=1932789 RepID=UPI002E04AF28|nr:GNAT family N-acetyltransferase [Jatrophihabitans sp.]
MRLCARGRPGTITVSSGDDRELARLLLAYHRQTEAEKGVPVAGCVVVTGPKDGSCEIKRLWTDPRFRGRGVASRLIEVARRRAAAAGVATVHLTVWQWRADAIALYERLGFRRSASWEERDGLTRMEWDV